MECTPSQIEEKRLLALQKLAAKAAGQSPVKPLVRNQSFSSLSNVQNNQSSTTSPKFKFQKRNSSDSPKPYEKHQGKPAGQFYGKDKVITGKYVLNSDERFVVELSGFNTQAVEVFKTIPTRSYDTKTRTWNFHIKDYDLLVSRMQVLQPNVVVDKLPSFVVNCIKAPKNEITPDLSKLDPELNAALMPFQLEGLSFGIDKNGRCLLADDMGLGKTFQALAIANYYKEDWPLLIATTATMKNVWEETIHKYLPSVSVMEIQYMISGKDYIGDAKVLIVSHDMMSRSVEKLLEKKFGVIIFDESHVLKNFKTKIANSASTLGKRAKRIVLLSGTPALSRPNELFTQLNLLDDKFFGSFFEYSKRYCDGKASHFGWDSSGKSNLQELEIILAKKFMIRRTKDQVLKTLPNKTQTVVTLDVDLNEFSETDRKCLNALADRYRSEKKGTNKHAALLTFFAETAKIKIPSVCSYILQILDSKKKFLVFAHHQKMMDSIENIVKKKNVKYIRIDGSTSSDQRKYFVDKFQLDNNYQCAVLSITAANAGITLTAAQLVLFAELHWNPSIISQAESRVHRIGQENPVFVRYLLAAGTADDSIWPMLQEKQKILSEIGLCKDSYKNVEVIKQNSCAESSVTDGLDITVSDCLGVTVANTLDITSYFKSSPQKNLQKENSTISNEEVEEFFNDGFDDILNEIDI